MNISDMFLKGREPKMTLTQITSVTSYRLLFTILVLSLLLSPLFTGSALARERNRVIAIPVMFENDGKPILLAQKITILPAKDPSAPKVAFNFDVKNTIDTVMDISTSGTLPVPAPGFELQWSGIQKYEAFMQIYLRRYNRNYSAYGGLGFAGASELTFLDRKLSGPTFSTVSNSTWYSGTSDLYSGREYVYGTIVDFPEYDQLDFSPPVLNVEIPEAPLPENTRSIWLQGAVTDDSHISAILIDDAEGTFSPIREQNGAFRAKCRLNSEGITNIAFHMWDDEGNYNTEQRQISVNSTTFEHFLSINTPADGYYLDNRTFSVTGTLALTSTSNVAQILVNGQSAQYSNTAENSVSYQCTTTAPLDGLFDVNVEAEDIYGNRDKLSRLVVVDTVPPSIDHNIPWLGVTGRNFLVEGIVDEENIKYFEFDYRITNLDDKYFSLTGAGGFPRFVCYDFASHSITNQITCFTDNAGPLVKDLSSTTPVFKSERTGWLSGTDMPLPLADPYQEITEQPTELTAITLEGKVYVLGIWHDPDTLSSNQVYDPLADSWIELQPMNEARTALSIAVGNNRIYSFGGWNGFTYVDTTEIYDPETNTWSLGPVLPSGRGGCAIVSVGTKIYLFGGESGTPWQSTYLDDVLCLDTLTNTWSNIASIPTPRKFAAASVLGNKIYLVGGTDQQNEQLSTNEVFNLDTGTWSQLPDMPTYRSHLALSSFDGKIYAIGGVNPLISEENLRTVEFYDPLSASWETGPSMCEPRNSNCATVLEDSIYVFGETNKHYIVGESYHKIAAERFFKGLYVTDMTGYIYDSRGIEYFTVGGLEPSISGRTFTINELPTQNSPTNGGAGIKIIARDSYDNITESSDLIPPDLNILHPVEGQILSTSVVEFYGTFSDSNINYIKVGSSIAEIDGTTFTCKLTLSDRSHRISVVAYDTSLNKVSKQVSITVETAPPVIAISFPPDGYTTGAYELTVTGTVTDSSGVNNVFINGIEAVIDGTTFEAIVPVSMGENTITATATDIPGNVSEATVTAIVNERPDLVVSNITYEPSSGITSEMTVTMKATIENIGLQPSAASAATFKVDGTKFQTVSFDALQVGESIIIEAIWDATAGLHSIEVGADWNDTVDELSEDNNNLSVNLPEVQDLTPPEDVTGLSIYCYDDKLVFSWTHSANSQNDLAWYRAYFNGSATPTIISSTMPGYLKEGLSKATSYGTFKVTAVDFTGNESAGKTIGAVTLLNAPVSLEARPGQRFVGLTFDGSPCPPALVSKYRIYKETAPFSTIAGLQPAIEVTGTSHTFYGLDDNVTYHFAVTAVNSVNCEHDSGSVIEATAGADVEGPVITLATVTDWDSPSTPLIDGFLFENTSTINVTLTDLSGVSRVEFLVDGTVLHTDYSGLNANFLWYIANSTDGAHTFTIRAYDTANNLTERSHPIVVALAPPMAPVIVSPVNGTITPDNSVIVTGTSEPSSQVLLYNNSAYTGRAISADLTGAFSSRLTLTEGANSLTAAASTRAGVNFLFDIVAFP
jgi:hypothetical protein